jgi:hypothetical protein
VKAAAATFRPNPRVKVEQVIGELAVGEALVSCLLPDGTPSPVECARICPPRSRIGAISAEERANAVAHSPLAGHYEQEVDRDSAYEALVGRATSVPAEAAPRQTAPAPTRADNPWGTVPRTGGGRVPETAPGRAPPPVQRQPSPRQQPPAQGGGWGDVLTGDGRRQGLGEAVLKSIGRSVGSSVGRQVTNAIFRNVLGGILRR